MASIFPEGAPGETKIDSALMLDLEFWAMVLDAFPMQIAHAVSVVGSTAHHVQWYVKVQAAMAGPSAH